MTKGMPRKPMTKREMEKIISNLENSFSENITKIEELDTDNKKRKDHDVIKEFVAMKKSDILAKTENEREILQWKILKALCLTELEEE